MRVLARLVMILHAKMGLVLCRIPSTVWSFRLMRFTDTSLATSQGPWRIRGFVK